METPLSLYVHIPFCASKCYYCDFNSYVARPKVFDDYLDALAIDLERQRIWLGDKPLDTVFVGGGTPTIFNARQLARLMTMIRRFPLSEDTEISIEANPGTVDEETLAVLREYGVSRISFGVQTLDDTLLQTLGRIHTRDDVFRSYELARRAGFSSINLDLMFGLPGQTETVWEDTVAELVGLAPDHISAYGLKIEEGTPFAVWYERGELKLPPEDTEAEMYLTVLHMLEQAGYEHYEISNFARPGHRCRHNQVYWRNEPYLAAGAGAHGYIGGRRFMNIRPVPAYIATVLQTGSAVEEERVVDGREAMEDTMILGLRLREGVSEERFHRKHGVSMDEVFGREIRELVARGLLCRDHAGVRIARTAIPLANEVFMAFIA